MIELRGKYNSAKVFTDNMENTAIAQIINLLNQEFTAGSVIRVMPDTHAGAGCTIGTTMTVTDKIVPNLVGVDIGCGMETAVLKETRAEPQQLDKFIQTNIPAGHSIRAASHKFAGEIDLTELRCAKKINLPRAERSLGTLGGGNHFIELDRDEEGRLYLVVHSGSRQAGKQTAEYYQDAAWRDLTRKAGDRRELIASLKAAGREKEIESSIRQSQSGAVNRALAYVEDELFDDYLHDMGILQRYAELNRRAIVYDICQAMKFHIADQFTTIHNYIDMKTMILRKGAISAQAGERVLIPLNMRDGSLICTGLGNPDWNYSAPHGAGRLMSRSAAREQVTLTDFKQAMQGIYSSTVSRDTIDESPFAYKPAAEIMENIAETARIDNIIKPLYNFKAM
ncbi:MAG: RtcB family protein [Gracilibacteraceae bacterium]|jgi:RNA-splicing ligase RtcB|nr:RtcB family protein [Gracilibacteraceae bacterium]